SLLRDEAIEAGDILPFAKDSLVRNLRERLPGGWGVGSGASSRASKAYGFWCAMLGEEWREAGWAVWKNLRALQPPTGWLPTNPSDPVLEAAFSSVPFNAPATPEPYH